MPLKVKGGGSLRATQSEGARVVDLAKQETESGLLKCWREAYKDKLVARLICTKSKQGQSLSQISELTGLTIDKVKETLAQATGLTPFDVSMILDMKQRGLSLYQISQDSGVQLEVLKQFLPMETVQTQIGADQGPYEVSLGVSERAYTLGSDCKTYSRSPPTTIEETKQPTITLPQHTPTFFYCCQIYFNKLIRVNLLTGEQSCHEVPAYQFRDGCRWSELPGGSLLVTGGDEGAREVDKIDTLREYAVSHQPPMHTARSMHAAVYHSQYLYVLAGYVCMYLSECESYLSECERYSCAEHRWEELPDVPVGGIGMSAVEVENSLYALGGYTGTFLDTVQKLSLDSLTWQLMHLRLPQATYEIACFKTETQVYLVIEDALYSFTPQQL
jgi:lambda repressor-like predicted transcriptional regulator